MGKFDEFDHETYKSKRTDFIRTNIADFIDALIVIILYNISFFSNNSIFFKQTDLNKVLFIFAFFLFYRLITILTIKRTIGMFLIGIEFSKEDKTKLNLKEKLLATIMVYVNGVDCYNIK